MSFQISEEEANSDYQSEIMDANLFSVIRNRRSTRSYLAKPVAEEMIRSLIDFSVQAPSAMNMQPWSFIVIQNPKLLKEISDKVKKSFFINPKFAKGRGLHGMHFLNDSDSEFDIFYGASTVIVICAKETEQKEFHTESDCFLAGENLMLSATGMGLATCPIGLATDVIGLHEMRIRLGIPSGYKPVLPIAVGYASSTPPPVDRNPPIIKWIS